jgi:tricorn protease
VLQLNDKPDLAGARTVTVVPVANEGALRHRAWIEDNRRKVAELSGGRVAYVYLPDTAGGGYSYFTRYFFSQLGCDAAVIDERFNGGGLVADYIVDLLNRPLLSWWATREGKPFQTPLGSILGPKVMLINEYAGSGGDALPNFFRRRGIGKLVGKRTWGGLVGIYDYPTLIDGGFLMSPRVAIFSPDGTWEVENEGVPPDVEVDILPKDWLAGHDRQLETAVEIVMRELEQHPIQRASRPAPTERAR